MKTCPWACRAPVCRAPINPDRSESRIIRTLSLTRGVSRTYASNLSFRWTRKHKTLFKNTCSNGLELNGCLTLVAIIVHKNDLFDQRFWRSIQNALKRSD